MHSHVSHGVRVSGLCARAVHHMRPGKDKYVSPPCDDHVIASSRPWSHKWVGNHPDGRKNKYWYKYHYHVPNRHYCPITCRSVTSETPETSEAASTVARQLVVLESKLNQRQQAENRQDHEDFGGVNETKGDGAAVRERLALLLQVLYLTVCVDRPVPW